LLTGREIARPTARELPQKCAKLELSDPDSEVRSVAVEAVGNLGGIIVNHSLLLHTFINLLCDADGRVRYRTSVAIKGLRKAATEHPVIIDHLARLLHHPRTEIRRSVLHAIRELGAVAATRAMVTRLPDLLNDVDVGVRCDTISAIEVLLRSVALPDVILNRLAQLLQDSERSVRAYAFGAVGALGTAVPEPILNYLVQLLQDPEADTHDAAAVAVGSLMGEGLRFFDGGKGSSSWKVRTVAELSR
jgi:HEAT repeat protein